jgi:hypothetical protein
VLAAILSAWQGARAAHAGQRAGVARLSARVLASSRGSVLSAWRGAVLEVARQRKTAAEV